MEIRYLPRFEESTTNPARCHIPTGRIEINQSRWDLLTPEEKDFVLQHEIGHYKQQTLDECRADNYALRQLALKKTYSLLNFVHSVRNISKNDPDRVQNATMGTLKVAADNGSTYAAALLKASYANAEGPDNTQRINRMIKITAGIVLAITLIVIWIIRK